MTNTKVIVIGSFFKVYIDVQINYSVVYTSMKVVRTIIWI